MQVSRVREQTLAILERLTESHIPSQVATDTLSALQKAANELGFVERALAAMAEPVDDVPAPIVVSDARGDPGGTRWSGEASAVMGLAEFSVPYASTAAEEVETWLRALRQTGSVGRALAELRFPEVELTPRAEPPTVRRPGALEAVRAAALAFARRRDATALSTTDILFAVIAIHDRLVDRALHERGMSRNALLARLAEDSKPLKVGAR
jgi:hypothetical protein